MKYGTRGGMEWGAKRETMCMWERVGIRKIKSMETWKNKILGKLEVWKFGKQEMEKY